MHGNNLICNDKPDLIEVSDVYNKQNLNLIGRSHKSYITNLLRDGFFNQRPILLNAFVILPSKLIYNILIYNAITLQTFRSLGLVKNISGSEMNLWIMVAMTVNCARTIKDMSILNNKLKLNPYSEDFAPHAKNKIIVLLHYLFGVCQITNLLVSRNSIGIGNMAEIIVSSKDDRFWYTVNKIAGVFFITGIILEVRDKNTHSELSEFIHHAGENWVQNKFLFLCNTGLLVVNILYSPAVIIELGTFIQKALIGLYGLIENIDIYHQDKIKLKDELANPYMCGIYGIISLVTIAELLAGVHIAENCLKSFKIIFEQFSYFLALNLDLIVKTIESLIDTGIICYDLVFRQSEIINDLEKLGTDILKVIKLTYCIFDLICEAFIPIACGVTSIKIILFSHLSHKFPSLFEEDSAIEHLGHEVEHKLMWPVIIMAFNEIFSEINSQKEFGLESSRENIINNIYIKQLYDQVIDKFAIKSNQKLFERHDPQISEDLLQSKDKHIDDEIDDEVKKAIIIDHGINEEIHGINEENYGVNKENNIENDLSGKLNESLI